MADIQSNIKVSIDTAEALANIKNLQRQISAFHTSMAKGGAAANAVTAQMQQGLINSINATGKFSAQMRTIRTTTESFTNSLEKNKFSLGEYFRYAGGASKTFGRLFKSEFETINKVARENVKDLQTQYIKMGRDANGSMKAIAVRPLSLDMNDLATKTMIASERQALLNQLLKQGSTNLLNFGKNTQWAGRQLMVGFTIPLITVGSAAAKTFMDMETQAIRFKKVYGDLFTPAAETKAALEGITELGKEFTKYGVAVSSTVGLAAEAAAAGFKGLDLQRQTAAATKLSILGQVESQKALETTISLQNAFSMSSENLAESIDFLNAVENQTVLSLDDMSTAIPKAAPVIQQLGGDVKDLAFFMTAMKEGGINASEGANALKSGLASMINPTGKANDLLLSFGINTKKIVESNRGDLKKTVIDFATALNQLDPLNRAQAIEQMFGKFQFARLSTLFANVTKEGTQAARVLDLAGSSVQDLAALSEKELGMTSESAMNKFKASVENLKLALVPVGEEFLKAVTPIAEFVTKILERFNNLGDGTKKIIVTMTAIVAGLGPVLLMTFGLLANGLANIIKGFTAMKTMFNKTGQSSATLGTEVRYMTLEQRNAAAVAASLDQVHRNLAQTFTAEATSVDRLTAAYARAIAAQSQFMPTRLPMSRGAITKRAKGKPATVGGTGNQDSELAYLMPGETVIPTDMSKKYGGLINGMIADSIPGYKFGKTKPGAGKVHMYPEYALRLQDAAENMGQRSGTTEVPNVLAPLALRIGETRGMAPTQGQINAGNFDDIYDEYEDITTRFVEKLNTEYNETFADIKDDNERMQRAWSSAGKHVEEQVGTIKSEAERSVVRKTFGLEKDEYGTIPTDSREAGGTTPNRARRGAFKAKLAGFRSYTAMRAGAKRLYERKTKRSAANLQMGHVYGPIEEDIATLQADPRKTGAVGQAAKIIDRGKKDGKAYEDGVKKSVKDPYVTSRDRNSPHRLAAQDGKADAIAYEDAKEKQTTQSGKKRRVATRKQGPANIGAPAPAGTEFLPMVAPLTDDEKRRDKKQKRNARIKGNAKTIGSRVNSFGGGMGLLGANMALGMTPDFAGKGQVQGALTGANLGMMFGPWGMAAGAAIGLVSTAIGKLIEKQKQLKAMSEATFKSSADLATFFGNAVVDTQLKVGSFSSSLGIVGQKAENIGKSFGYTNEELKTFIDLVASLPENNPLKDIVDGLANEKNPETIKKIAQAFVTTQVAIGQIKPDQAQKTLDLILAASGKASMVGSIFMNLKTQVDAISASLKNAKNNSTALGTSMTQLIGAASNATSLEQLTLILDGIAASGISAASALSSMYYAYLQVGNIEAAGAVEVLQKVSGITAKQSALVLTAISKGFKTVVNAGTNAKKLASDAEKFLKDPKLWKTEKPGVNTRDYQGEAKIGSLKKEIDLLKQKKKLIDDQIKKEQRISDELKKQNDYREKQASLDKQIVEAKIRGNYIDAANLLQEKQANTSEFNQSNKVSGLQAQSDALQAQIDKLESSSDKVVSAVNATTSAVTNGANAVVSAIGGISFEGGDGSSKSKAVSIPTSKEAIQTYVEQNKPRMGSAPKAGPILKSSATKQIDAAAAFEKGNTGARYRFEEYVRSQNSIKNALANLEKPEDGIVVSAVGSNGKTYTFKVTKGGAFTRVAESTTRAIKTPGVGGRARGGMIRNYAGGGLILGPGTGTSDSIRASFGYAGGGGIRVSNGEFVVRASSVRDYGVNAMNAVNKGTATIGTNSGGTVYNINMPITSNNANPEGVANEVMRRLKVELNKNNKSNRVNI
jgi:TP901 family phage tail tape measure protein